MQSISTLDHRRRRVAHLTEQLRLWELPDERDPSQAAFSSGCRELDGLLPAGGFCRGSLVEWIAGGRGSGATMLALKIARAACAAEGQLVVIDPQQTFFPPAAAALGLRPEQLLLVRPRTHGDMLWAVDQALRCGGVSAVLAWPKTLDHRTFRRWQLAAEESGVLGLLVRPRTAMAEASWAAARLLVEPRPSHHEQRRWRISLLHARGGWRGGKTLEVMMHHETGKIAVADNTTANHVTANNTVTPDVDDQPAPWLRLVSPLAGAAVAASTASA